MKTSAPSNSRSTGAASGSAAWAAAAASTICRARCAANRQRPLWCLGGQASTPECSTSSRVQAARPCWAASAGALGMARRQHCTIVSIRARCASSGSVNCEQWGG